MGAARWVVIGTALVAAAVAFHLLLSPDGNRRAVSMPERISGADGVGSTSSTPGPSGAGSASRAEGPRDANASRETSGRPRPAGGPPQEELDAASRDAMRSFLRESAQDGKSQ